MWVIGKLCNHFVPQRSSHLGEMRCPSLGTWRLYGMLSDTKITPALFGRQALDGISGARQPACWLYCVLWSDRVYFHLWLFSGVLWAIGRFLIVVLNPVPWKLLISFPIMIYSAEKCSVLSWVRRCVTLFLLVWGRETEVPFVCLHKMLPKQTASLQS